jgi:hypothetical protein
MKRLPAAMAAGIDNRLWELSDFIALTDAFVAERAKFKAERIAHIEAFVARRKLNGSNAPVRGALTITLDASEVVPAPSHWVYHSHIHHSTKVHEASCSSCRDGAGRRGSRPGAAEWLQCYSLEDAAAMAEAVSPERNSICSLCIGEYRESVRPLR